MARSIFSGGYGHNLQLELLVDTVRQDSNANQSVVRAQVRLIMSQYGALWGMPAKQLNLSINGSQESVMVDSNINYGQTKTLFTKEYTISHNEDGTKSFTASASITINVASYGSATVNQPVYLTPISRGSQASLSQGIIGQAMTISLTKPSQQIRHTLRYSWYNKSDTIASNVDSSYSWTIPTNFAQDIPNATSGQGTLYVDSYDGNRKLSTREIPFTANIPESMKPTLTSLLLSDSNAVIAQMNLGNNFLQVMSNIRVNFNGAGGSFGSTIAGYHAEIVGRNQTTNTNGGQLGIMNWNGQATIRAWVVDSRGQRSDSKDIQITVMDYFAPVLSFTAQRTRENPNKIAITRNAKIASLTVAGSQKNTMRLTFRVAETGNSNFTNDTGSAAGEWQSLSELVNSQALLAGDYLATKSFTIVGRLEDRFTATEFTATVTTEKVVFSYEKDGRVGIGKIADQRLPVGSLDVSGNIYAKGQHIQQKPLTDFEGNLNYVPNYNQEGRDANQLFFEGVKFYGLDKVLNMPHDGWFYMLNMPQNDNYGVQVAIEKQKKNRLFIRGKETGQWSGWEEFAKTSHPALQQKPLKSVDIAYPYGLTANLTRKDNLVTVSIKRKSTSMEACEEKRMNEIIPIGFRPTSDVALIMSLNNRNRYLGCATMRLTSKGEMFLSNPTSEIAVFQGTVSYITNDSYPN